ncbi:MAG: efflux RND transporter periplasmic adaptor subunit, partial [Thalassotalea sp.]|nr:efflux RND transporter periplasmic adaptor subunit [Thalassotalea sp.]
LMRKEVALGWQNGMQAIVESGLVFGDELVLTSLGQVSSGTPVAIEGDAIKPSRGNRKGEGKQGAEDNRENKAKRETAQKNGDQL